MSYRYDIFWMKCCQFACRSFKNHVRNIYWVFWQIKTLSPHQCCAYNWKVNVTAECIFLGGMCHNVESLSTTSASKLETSCEKATDPCSAGTRRHWQVRAWEGELPYVNDRAGILVVSLRGVNCRFVSPFGWSWRLMVTNAVLLFWSMVSLSGQKRMSHTQICLL